MSLSFPLLISAVPLRALDMTRRRTRDAVDAVESGRQPVEPLVADVCWFSDGGITSNFPVHFFDTPLPTRPTFAIDLDGFHPDHPARPGRGRQRLPPVLQRRRAARQLAPARPEARPREPRRVRERDRPDDAEPRRRELTHQPGYRDRIVHVHTAPDEGGMNLTMPPRRDRRAHAPRAGGRPRARRAVRRDAGHGGRALVGQPPLGALPQRACGARRAARALGRAWR